MFYTSVERRGNFMLVRGYDEGKPVKFKEEFHPTLFVSTKKNTDFHSLYGVPLDSINPGTMQECKDFIETYSDIENFDVHGNRNYIAQYISKFFNDKNEIDWTPSLVDKASIDIEVNTGDAGFPKAEEALYEINAITIKSSREDCYYTWGLVEYDSTKSILPHIQKKYVKCKNEKELLTLFLDHWKYRYPNVITGWNSKWFDMLYVYNRMVRILGPNQANELSPWNIVRKKVQKINNDEIESVEIAGIQQLDYMELFKKFGYVYGTPENNKLDTVAYMVLGENKLDYSEYGNLFTLYKDNPQLFIDYNIKDTELIARFEDKMGLINLVLTLAYKAGVNYDECFGTVGIWDALIYNKLREKNIVIPPKTSMHKDFNIEGAYVKDPKIGFYEWVVSFDLTSLYPSLMMMFNLSPETIRDATTRYKVDELLNKIPLNIPADHCCSALGQLFDTKKIGVIPSIIQEMFDERATVKKEMLKYKQLLENEQDATKKISIEREITRLDTIQMALKILMNSVYGAMSNVHFRYFDVRLAESITITGQLAIRWAEQTINNFFNKLMGTSDIDYVIYCDTDSMYINFKTIVDKFYKKDKTDVEGVINFIDKICENKLTAVINNGYEELRKYLNAPIQKLIMKREAIADKGIWIGKKRYILRVYNNEGVHYAKPKIKMLGIEAVRSSTPAPCRKMIKDCLEIILDNDEVKTQKFIKTQKEIFKSLKPEEVAFPRGVSELDKFSSQSTIYSKGTPIHVRAALLYNNLLTQQKLKNRYETIKSGNKIKFLYLKMPNKLRENVIGFSTILPKEFELHNSIDYNMQFDKSFIDPIRNILDCINWNVEPISTLDSFFD